MRSSIVCVDAGSIIQLAAFSLPIERVGDIDPHWQARELAEKISSSSGMMLTIWF
jgi:hypothetical protein